MNYGSVRCKLNIEMNFLAYLFLKKINQFYYQFKQNTLILNLIKYTRLYQMSITNLFEYKVLDCYVWWLCVSIQSNIKIYF